MYTIDTTHNVILFAYKRDDIYDDVRHLSTFMAKNAVSKEGQPLLEQFSITEDEEPMFMLCLRDCLPDVWEVMVKLTHGVDEPYKSDEEYETDTTVGDITFTADTPYVTFRLVNSGAYNPNLLTIVDSSIRSTMEQGVLEKWYTRIAQADLLKVAQVGWASEASSLARRLMQLLRKSVYPPVS